MGRETAKNILILLLLAATAFSLVTGLLRWRTLHFMPENRSEFFFGYKAFFSPLINFIWAGDWGMEPTIKENDAVLWVHLRPEDVLVGDIVIYRDNSGRLIGKRVVETTGDSFVVRGDGLQESLTIRSVDGIAIGVIYAWRSRASII